MRMHAYIHSSKPAIMLAVNFFGIVRMVKSFLPLLKDQAVKKTHCGMRIVNLTSMAGLCAGVGGFSTYAASKHAAQAFNTCLRSEMKGFKIHVTSVNPSFHGTSMTDSILDMANSQWKKLPAETKHQYGECKFLRKA
jgi:dehydrogenase/reductase SDR family protein 7C